MSREIWKIIIGIVTLSIAFAQQQQTPSELSSALCNAVGIIKASVTIIAVAMFVVGGLLYAIGNLLTGGMKQSAHGWAQSLIIGGIVGIILVLLAQPLVNLFTGMQNLPSVTC
ncbi:MAG: hypothetical protein ACP5HJ_04015 [Candidatus Micrarchaeia archaeon]